jgi:maltooligosyltrehalose trehalohydrolase
VTISVWAPLARRVRAVVDGDELELGSSDDGWWSVASPEGALRTGTRYGFLLDDDDAPLPDPRSRWQPDGVHDLSAVYHPSEFEWTDDDWSGRELAGSSVYELHIGTFTPEGTLDSAIERLPHLVELGVDFVELLPMNGFEGTHNWGYDGVLWFSVDDSYGGPAAYQRFVDACHRHGLAVIQDVVYNHLGPSGNYMPRFAPYLRHDASNAWGAEIDLDLDGVRRHIIDSALMWLGDYHVDGLRIDAVHALTDRRPTHVLAELATEVQHLAGRVGRPLTLIAESDLNDPIVITPLDAGGWGMDAQWCDDFHHALHVALTGERYEYLVDYTDLGALAKAIRRGFVIDGTFSTFRQRKHGRPLDLDATPPWRLVVFDQNHDQVGNRVVGDRLAANASPAQLAVAAVLTLASPFTPMIFMGEEWAATTPWQFFSAYQDPELGRATSDGRAREFAGMGWDPDRVPDPQQPATFVRSKLDWSELEATPHRHMFDLYRHLIRLRRDEPALTDPNFSTIAVDVGRDPDDRWIVVRRAGGVTIAANLGDEPVTVDVAGELLLATDPAIELDDQLALPGWSAAIVRR